MTALLYLLPISLILAGIALLAFLWTVRSGQYEDPAGDAERILQADDVPLSPTHAGHDQSGGSER